MLAGAYHIVCFKISYLYVLQELLFGSKLDKGELQLLEVVLGVIEVQIYAAMLRLDIDNLYGQSHLIKPVLIALV